MGAEKIINQNFKINTWNLVVLFPQRLLSLFVVLVPQKSSEKKRETTDKQKNFHCKFKLASY